MILLSLDVAQLPSSIGKISRETPWHAPKTVNPKIEQGTINFIRSDSLQAILSFRYSLPPSFALSFSIPTPQPLINALLIWSVTQPTGGDDGNPDSCVFPFASP